MTNKFTAELVDPDFLPQFLSVAEAADYLSVSPQMVHNYIRDGHLAARKARSKKTTGRKDVTVIDREDLVDFYARKNIDV